MHPDPFQAHCQVHMPDGEGASGVGSPRLGVDAQCPEEKGLQLPQGLGSGQGVTREG